MNPDKKFILRYKELAQHGSNILVRAMALALLRNRVDD